MILRKVFVVVAVVAALAVAATSYADPAALAKAAGMDQFSIKPFTANQFYTFVKVFGEMRGPLRSEILKDRKTDFENADPLKYVEKVKNAKDVRKALADNDITWEQFADLWGNIMLGYLSIQQESTKAALIRQVADYGLAMNVDEIPQEYRPMLQQVLKSDAGSTLAAAALEYVIQIPPQNIEIVKENRKDLDRMFYTKYWAKELK